MGSFGSLDNILGFSPLITSNKPIESLERESVVLKSASAKRNLGTRNQSWNHPEIRIRCEGQGSYLGPRLGAAGSLGRDWTAVESIWEVNVPNSRLSVGR